MKIPRNTRPLLSSLFVELLRDSRFVKEKKNPVAIVLKVISFEKLVMTAI